MNAAAKEAVFLSIPKTFSLAAVPAAAWIEDARGCPVHDRLRIATNTVVVTFRFFGESPGAGTAANRLLDRIVDDTDVIYIHGERTAVTLSLNVYAKKGTDVEGEQAVDTYLETALMPWLLRDLPAALAAVSSTVTGRGSIDDLTDLEDGLVRRHLDVFLEAPTTYRRTETSIDTVAVTVDLATDPTSTTVRIAIPPQSDTILRDVPVLLVIQGLVWSRMFAAIGDDCQKISVRDAFSLTDLPVEIMAWNAAAGTALVWVRVPTLAAAGTTLLTLTYDPAREDNTAYVGTTAEPADHPVWETAIGLWPWIALTHWVEPDPAPECLHL